jgi:acyl carrier protein
MSEQIEQRVKTLLAKVMRVDVATVTADASTDSMVAWDSLNHIKLVLALEEEFDLAFDENQIEKMTSVAKVVSVIAQLRM